MLDRKIKDIDASIELLEDRKTKDKYQFALNGCLGIITLIAGVIFWFMQERDIFYIYVSFFSLLIAIITFIMGTWNLMSTNHYNMLIYFKKYIEGDKK